MTNYSRIAAVTGGNKGVGLAIVRQLALQYPSSQFNNGPLLIYLAARDKSRGEAAIRTLLADPTLKKAKALSQDSGLADIKYAELDIASNDSIDNFAAALRKDHPDGIDFVINNAGIAMNGFDDNVVKQTLDINYYGTLHATQTFLPLLRRNGRLVNLSSMAGKTGKYSPALQDRFKHVKSVDEVNSLMTEFKSCAANGIESLQQHGWTAAAYSASKAGLTAVTRVIAQQEVQAGRNVLVNSCCPGWVRTDMTKGQGHKTTDEGAQTPVLLALGDIHGKFGLFWQDEQPISEVK